MEIRSNKKVKNRILIMSVLLLLIIVISLKAGAVKISISDISNLFIEKENTPAWRILMYIRIPRIMGAILAGMGLSVAGAIIQTILNNPLAGPNVIGVNSGAGFAVVLCSMFLPHMYVAFPFFAFLGAFITVIFVYFIARYTGSSKITLILSGVAVNSLLSAGTDAIYTFSQDSLINSSSFRIGGLSGVNTSVLMPAGIAILVSVILTISFHNELEVLSMGEETASTLGLPVSFYRFIFLILAAVLAGAAVSFAGLLGFVGLIVPHIVRILVGNEFKYFIPASAILGALFLLFCDLLARTLFMPYELPVGILLSFIGAPFFIWLLIGQRRGDRND